MGTLMSRQNPGVEEIDIGANHAYRYPPKSGNYFGNHFIMGGERFDTPQPEAYLFGENVDLNFLGCRPAPFPYPAPQPNEPIKTLKSFVNIRKESLRFVRLPDEEAKNDRTNTQYNIEFTFDSDVRCAITIHYFCTEEVTAAGVVFSPRDPNQSSETYHYKRGANQQFGQMSNVFDPSLYTEDELNYSLEKEVTPIVIQCIAEQGDEPRQQHITLAVVEKNVDGTYCLKALKQKQFVDGLCFLLQELYGIENKNFNMAKNLNEDEVDENGSECVICMCDTRDTLILPCRHLCLCNNCADSLRYQANNCPICRAPFRALLQIRALRKIPPATRGAGDAHVHQIQEGIPAGYEFTSLIEALNGPPRTNAALSSVLRTTAQPLAVIAQDAVTSPSLPNPVEPFHRRACSGTLRCIPVTEDSSAQTDSQVSIPLENVTEVAILLSSDQAGTDDSNTDSSDHQSQEVLQSSSDEKSQQSSSEVRSLLEPCPESNVKSHSTPGTLHLCDTRHTNASPNGEESDYYTPEDPNIAILSEGGNNVVVVLHHSSPLSPVAEVHASDERSEDDDEVEELSAADDQQPMSRPSVKALSRTMLMDIGSAPGTPQSQTSNRSSGDSFSSSSSTRYLLSTSASPEYTVANTKV